MKKKILFYGNCQTGVLGEWLHNNYSDKFEIVDCRECGLSGFWTTKNFAVWSPENFPNQKNFYQSIQDKIKTCDVFIFTHMEKRLAIEELQTQNLCLGVAKNKLKICVPNVRFLAYPICGLTLDPFIKYVYQNVSKDAKEIFDYLLNENDPKFEEIIKEKYNTSMNENILRHENNSKIYPNILDMNEFISNNWKTHLLFGTHNHPVGIYWEELIKKLFEFFDEPLKVQKIENLEYPNKDGIIKLQSFLFFRNFFPNIIIPSEIGRFYDTRIDIIKQPLEQHYA